MGDEMMGFRLKQARERAGLTQDAVCQKIGLANNQSVSSYERGTTSPPIETLKKLCRLYGVSADYLLFGESHFGTRERTDCDYAKQLVDAADHLGLKVEEVTTDLGQECMAICITSAYGDFNKFANHWSRLREVLDNRILEREEYIMLISRRLEELKMVVSSRNGSLISDEVPNPSERE